MQKNTQVSDPQTNSSDFAAHSSCAGLPAWSDWLAGYGDGWRNALLPVLETAQGKNLHRFLAAEHAAGDFYPPPADLFTAFRLTPLEDVRVVILGQDPYHGKGEAHGLAFSVRDGVKIPPSLRNIYKEISATYNSPAPSSGNLTRWAQQGVLLLNTVLTVRPDNAASHQGKGWEDITDEAIRAVNVQRSGVVFMLWGSHAQKKKALIDASKHLLLEAPHPSPLSAHRGFMGCAHFAKANAYFESAGVAAIDWAGACVR